MLEPSISFRGARGGSSNGARGNPAVPHCGRGRGHRPAWSTDGGAPHANGHSADGERWERGRGRGAPGAGRARKGNMTWRKPVESAGAGDEVDMGGAEAADTELEQHEDDHHADEDYHAEEDAHADEDVEELDALPELHEPPLESADEREAFYQRLVREREAERKRAIAEGKMDDPLVAKRLEDAICVVGTCMDMCPRFERYRRERENNLDRLELIPGTKRVDHRRAVKKYERAVGDKTLPSDLRPPPVLRLTLNYLFRELIPEKGFSAAQAFVRDRSRACRTDCTMQHETERITIECHDRCARFHILSMHLERDKPGFSVDMEEQQLAYTLQSLKDFYREQRGTYQSPTEIEMRVYHRLVHIRDQVDHGSATDPLPEWVARNPVFELVTRFRAEVQRRSAPITKRSALAVDEKGMRIFGELAAMLRAQGNVVMIYLVACILERHFGKGTIENIEGIHGGMPIPDIIDGKSAEVEVVHGEEEREEEGVEGEGEDGYTEVDEEEEPEVEVVAPPATTTPFGQASTAPAWPPVPSSSGQSAFGGTISAFTQPSAPSPFGGAPSASAAPKSAFASLATTPNAFGTPTSVFGGPTFNVASSSTAPQSAFGAGATPSPFGTQAPTPAATTPSVFGNASSSSSSSPFGGAPAGPSTSSTAASNPFGQPPPRNSLADAPALSTTPQAPSIAAPEPTKPPGPSFLSTGSQPSLNAAASPFVPGSTKPSFFNTPPQQPAPSNSFAPPTSTAFTASPASAAFAASPAPSPFAFPPPRAAEGAPTAPAPGNPFAAPPAAAIAAPSAPFSFMPTPPADPPALLPQAPAPAAFPAAPSNTFLSAPSNAFPSAPNSAPTKPPSPTKPGPARPAPLALTLPRRISMTLAMPSPLKITTSGFSDPTTFSALSALQPGTPGTPGAPPALDRKAPLSLPPTPTVPDAKPVHAQGSLLSFPRGGAAGGGEGGSTLGMPAPGPSRMGSWGAVGPSPLGMGVRTAPPSPERKSPERKSPERKTSVEVKTGATPTEQPAPGSPPSLKKKRSFSVKGKEPARWDEDLGRDDPEDIQRALAFRKAWAARRVLTQLGKVVAKRASYRAAQARAEEYGRQTRAEPKRPAEREDREEVQVPRKRKKRVSRVVECPPTDEELVQRFSQNHEDSKRRWAHGSFLDAVHARVGGAWPRSWQVWLSCNAESDGTAIWLQTKFDVESNSGAWASENVYAIPAAEKGEALDPGVVVFECTPLVGDELESKYRILEDCTRLKDLIELLPPERRYLATVVLVVWGEEGKTRVPTDITDMLDKSKKERIIASHVSFFVTAAMQDTDDKFGELLKKIDLDVEGRLAHPFTPQELYSHLLVSYVKFQSQWASRCANAAQFNWQLYSYLLSASIQVFNAAIKVVHRLWGLGPPPPLLALNPASIINSDTAYTTLTTWLEQKLLRQVSQDVVTRLIQEQREHREFPAHDFSANLHKLIWFPISVYLKTRGASEQTISNNVVEEAYDRMESLLDDLKDELSDVPSPRATPVPETITNGKRRISDAGANLSYRSTNLSPDAKRPRLTPNGDHSFSSLPVNGHAEANGSFYGVPPTPSEDATSVRSASTSVNGDKPAVSIAQLRALTQNVKRKYGMGS